MFILSTFCRDVLANVSDTRRGGGKGIGEKGIIFSLISVLLRVPLPNCVAVFFTSFLAMPYTYLAKMGVLLSTVAAATDGMSLEGGISLFCDPNSQREMHAVCPLWETSIGPRRGLWLRFHPTPLRCSFIHLYWAAAVCVCGVGVSLYTAYCATG